MPRKRLGRQRREKASKVTCPAAVTQRMYLHPDSVLPLTEFYGAATAGHPEMPVVTPRPARKRAFAPDHESLAAAFVESLASGQLEIEFKHGLLRSYPPD